MEANPAWAALPKTNEQRLLAAVERIEKLIADYVLTQTHPKQVVPSQNAAPKPIGRKR